jgi:hypothetical protein
MSERQSVSMGLAGVGAEIAHFRVRNGTKMAFSN